MPRITKAMLVAENTDLKQRLEEVNAGYWTMIEDLQKLGEDYGCLPGSNRLHWLRERLELLHAHEQRGN